MLRTIIYIIVSILVFESIQAQEFKCRVAIQAKDKESNPELYKNLQKSVEQFMNNTKWTDHIFEDVEKLEMSLVINVESQSSGTFQSKLQVVANRPVFNSSYLSPLINLVDESFVFKYTEFENIEFNENAFVSNLSSVLAYYAYFVLGLNYDSFAQNGGARWFQKAEMITNAAQNNGYNGWSSNEADKRNNRYWMIENALNSSYATFHNAMYKYHRLGLDIMHEKDLEGRAKISDALTDLETVYDQRPGLSIISVFMNAKYAELQSIYSVAQPDELKRAITQMKKLDPARSADYDKLSNQQ